MYRKNELLWKTLKSEEAKQTQLRKHEECRQRLALSKPNYVGVCSLNKECQSEKAPRAQKSIIPLSQFWAKERIDAMYSIWRRELASTAPYLNRDPPRWSWKKVKIVFSILGFALSKESVKRFLNRVHFSAAEREQINLLSWMMMAQPTLSIFV